MQYHYRLYGMRVTTDLDFIQLDPVRLRKKDGEEDFPEEVRIFAMNEEEEAQFHREHGDCVCGSFLDRKKSWLCNRTLEMSVERGRKIRYRIRKGGDPGAARTYLLGFGMAILTMQQGKLAIHCSALESPQGEALLIAGESGAGKSTLTAALLDRGYRFLADDMAVAEISGADGVWVYPAFPYMKLCRDVALKQGYAPEELLYIDEKKDKFLVPCREVFQREKVRLKHLVFLEMLSENEEPEGRPGEIKAEKITGPDSMLVYKENLFLHHLWKRQDPGMEIWQNCLKMAEQIPVYSVKRPAAGDSTAEVAAEVHALQVPCQLKNSSGSSEGCGG